MSVPPPSRPGVVRPGQARPPQTRPAGIGASYAVNQTPQGRPSGYIPVQPIGRTEMVTQAPTLGQFWRSDIRRTSDARRPRWAGLAAFWIGLLAVALLFAGNATGLQSLRAVALALSAVAGFFALIAIIAGIGRALGVLGAILALAGNVFVVAWALRLLGG